MLRYLLKAVPLLLLGGACGAVESPAPASADADRPAAAAASEPAHASRIVSLGGGVTETVFALGHGDRVVAADASSKVPADAASKATLGFYRRVSAEGILAQSPTEVLASEGTGPPAVLDQLRSANVVVHTIPAAVSIEDARERMRTVGSLLGAEERAQALIASMDAELLAVDHATAGMPAPRVLFIYARGGGTLMVAGRDTSAQTVIEASGGTLAAPDHEGFRPLTSEAVVAAAPDVVLVTVGGMEALGGSDGVLAAPGLSATPAGRDGRIIAIDDNLLLGMGPRTGLAVRTLAGRLHPDATL